MGRQHTPIPFEQYSLVVQGFETRLKIARQRFFDYEQFMSELQEQLDTSRALCDFKEKEVNEQRKQILELSDELYILKHPSKNKKKK